MLRGEHPRSLVTHRCADAHIVSSRYPSLTIPPRIGSTLTRTTKTSSPQVPCTTSSPSRRSMRSTPTSTPHPYTPSRPATLLPLPHTQLTSNVIPSHLRSSSILWTSGSLPKWRHTRLSTQQRSLARLPPSLLLRRVLGSYLYRSRLSPFTPPIWRIRVL